MYAISQLSGSGPSSSFSSGFGTVVFGDSPSSLGASGGTSAGLVCGAISPEASVLLSSCSLDSEVTRGQDESGPSLSLKEESERQGRRSVEREMWEAGKRDRLRAGV